MSLSAFKRKRFRKSAAYEKADDSCLHGEASNNSGGKTLFTKRERAVRSLKMLVRVSTTPPSSFVFQPAVGNYCVGFEVRAGRHAEFGVTDHKDLICLSSDVREL